MSAVEINVKGILMASGDNLMESVFTSFGAAGGGGEGRLG